MIRALHPVGLVDHGDGGQHIPRITFPGIIIEQPVPAGVQGGGQAVRLVLQQRQILLLPREPGMTGEGGDEEHPVKDIFRLQIIGAPMNFHPVGLRRVNDQAGGRLDGPFGIYIGGGGAGGRVFFPGVLQRFRGPQIKHRAPNSGHSVPEMSLVVSAAARWESSRAPAHCSILGDKLRCNGHADRGMPAERRLGSAKSWMTVRPGRRRKNRATRTMKAALTCRLMLRSIPEPQNGASEGIRTLDTHVGNVMLYQAELRSRPEARGRIRKTGALASPICEIYGL